MKPFQFAACALLFLATMFSAPPKAVASGFGLATGFGYGSVKETLMSGPNNFSETRESVGLVFDSNLGRDHVFNYRGTVSYQMLQVRGYGEHSNSDGISIENDFGFRVIRNEQLRLWIGPEVKVEIFDTSHSGNHPSGNLHFGVGPVVGTNIDLGNDFTLAVKAGYVLGVGLFSEERYGTLAMSLIYQLGEDRTSR
jgi:hypothetical protein